MEGTIMVTSTIVQLPLAFVRSGYIALDGGRVLFIGDRGHIWSSISQLSTSAYHLYMDMVGVGTTNYFHRWGGLPLRIFFLLPLAFVRSGYVSLDVGISYDVGVVGFGWSRVAQSTGSVYRLDMTPTVVRPSNSYYRWFGFPLRCLSGRCKIKPTDYSAGLCR